MDVLVKWFGGTPKPLPSPKPTVTKEASYEELYRTIHAIEVVEGDLTRKVERAQKQARALRRQGNKLALDDALTNIRYWKILSQKTAAQRIQLEHIIFNVELEALNRQMMKSIQLVVGMIAEDLKTASPETVAETMDDLSVVQRQMAETQRMLAKPVRGPVPTMDDDAIEAELLALDAGPYGTSSEEVEEEEEVEEMSEATVVPRQDELVVVSL